MSYYCLFDTNALIKRYNSERGTDIVDYLFKSPAVVPTISNIQVAEVVRTFYKLREIGKIKTDNLRDVLADSFLKEIDNGENNGRIKVWDLVNEHLKEIETVCKKISETPPPVNRNPPPTHKFRANTIDALMLTIMREIHFLAESQETYKDAYLVSSDEHVLDVAKGFGLKTIDPENVSILSLPAAFEIRRHKRITQQIRVVFKESTTKRDLGSACTMDICESGILVRFNQSLTLGKQIDIKLFPLNRNEPTIDTAGEVVWVQSNRLGIKLREIISSDLYPLMFQN